MAHQNGIFSYWTHHKAGNCKVFNSAPATDTKHHYLGRLNFVYKQWQQPPTATAESFMHCRAIKQANTYNRSATLGFVCLRIYGHYRWPSNVIDVSSQALVLLAAALCADSEQVYHSRACTGSAKKPLEKIGMTRNASNRPRQGNGYVPHRCKESCSRWLGHCLSPARWHWCRLRYSQL